MDRARHPIADYRSSRELPHRDILHDQLKAVAGGRDAIPEQLNITKTPDLVALRSASVAQTAAEEWEAQCGIRDVRQRGHDYHAYIWDGARGRRRIGTGSTC